MPSPQLWSIIVLSLFSSSIRAIAIQHPRWTNTSTPLPFQNKATISYTPQRQGSWTEIISSQCSSDAFKDQLGPTSDMYKNRWEAAQADDAWNNLVDEWKKYVAIDRTDDEVSNWPFYRFAALFFGYSGALNLDCAEPQNNAQCQPFECEQVPYVGGWLILQSIHNIWAAFNSLSTALHTADTEAIGQMGAFQETFSPKIDDSGLSLILSMMGAFNGLAFSAAGAAFPLEEVGELAMEGFNTLVETGIEFGKQWADDQASDEHAITASLNELCTQIWEMTSTAMDSTLRDLMAGDPAALHDSAWANAPSLETLLNLISDGAMLAVRDDLSKTMNAQGESMIYGGLLRANWQQENNQQFWGAPYVFYVPASVYKCGDDPSTAGLIQGDSLPLTTIFTADDASKRVYCDPDGNSYFLAGGTYPSTLAGGDSDALTGEDGTWGKITLESITQSAFNGFINNGFQNGFDINTGSAKNYVQDWTQGKLTGNGAFVAPGFFNFAVCFSVDSVETNWKAWWGDPENPVHSSDPMPVGYPCQEGSHADATGFIDAYNQKHGYQTAHIIPPNIGPGEIGSIGSAVGSVIGSLGQ